VNRREECVAQVVRDANSAHSEFKWRNVLQWSLVDQASHNEGTDCFSSRTFGHARQAGDGLPAEIGGRKLVPKLALMLYANNKQYAGFVFRYQHLFVVLFSGGLRLRYNCGSHIIHLVARVWCV
jgi:hypothetical protein